MLRSHQFDLDLTRVRRGTLPIGAVMCAVVLAGCSADISRLERPSYGLGERAPIPQEPIGRRNAGAPPAYENSGWSDSGARPGSAAPLRNDRVVALPDAAAPVNPSVPFDAPRKPKSATNVVAASAPAPARSMGAPIVPGMAIEIQAGDSLYGLSKRHHVSIAALMELNGLKNATLKPGQKIVLPANAQRPLAKAPTAAPAASPVGQAALPAVAQSKQALPTAPKTPAAQPAAAAASDWDGSYVVKSGDSLYGIARAYKIQVSDLQRQNGITDALKMKPGMTLKVPAGGHAANAPANVAEAPSTTTTVTTTTPVAVSAAVPVGQASGGIRLLNPPADALPAKEAAAVAPVKVAGPATAAAVPASGAKFRWPAKGAMLAGFGKRPDGAHNDGINIAVPKGTDIAAADAGTVAYAGGEIKAYGNLVLIRHEGGWVTAYAHADQILVKRGDQVTRGQVIAKAGATGSVDQPQVHFELRQGAKPIDPAPHMEK